MARRPHPDGSTPRGFDPVRQARLIAASVPPVHPGGYPFIAAPAAAALLARSLGWSSVARLAAGAAAASVAFFRAPRRTDPPAPSTTVVAPADGEIVLVDTAVPPAETGLGSTPLPRVSVFMTVLDVHVQRTPISGTVRSVDHRPGEFLSADVPDASERNERTSLVLDTDLGTVAVIQIAGLVARRIRTDVTPGDRLSRGDIYGLIRFGSRVDVYLPPTASVIAYPGQRAVGGQTLLAKASH